MPREKMGVLAKLLSYVPQSDRQGIRLEIAGCWEVSGLADAPEFLRALVRLIPAGCNLYVEGTYDRSVAKWLQQRSASTQTQVAVGTIWPRPDVHHMSATEVNLIDLAEFLKSGGLYAPWSHVHVYQANAMHLSWHDAFDDPMYVARSVEEEAVKRFCSETNCSYTQVEGAS